MTTPYDQEGASARLRWGRRGARAALAAGDVLVVVDVLSFSTATALALAAGAEVIPAAPGPAAAEEVGRALSVLACGERWAAPDPDDGGLRVALEDALGAGAVLDALGLPCSPEAEHCRLAFAAAREAGRLAELVRGCGSGRELIERGFAADVELACQLDSVALAPRLEGGSFKPERAALGAT